MVLGALKFGALLVLVAAMVMLVVFMFTSQRYLLTGGIFGVLLGGATLTYVKKARQAD